MDSIMVCNTASDSLSIISLENDSVYNIPLLLNKKNLILYTFCTADGIYYPRYFVL